MTVTEFSNEFDIAYNNIATNASPNIDLYEKSVYLTKAQLEIIKNYFQPKGNKYQQGFESSSKRRSDFSELIKQYVSFDEIPSDNGISEESQFYGIPNDIFIIIQESAKLDTEDTCLKGKNIDVVPKTHDEFNVQKKNPFKKPNEDVIWRLDYSIQTGINKNIELVSPYTIKEYDVRYIKYPSPIILSDLDILFPNEGLSIDGQTTEQTCKLSESLHKEILDRAVELALIDYKPSGAQLKIQADTRNE